MCHLRCLASCWSDPVTPYHCLHQVQMKVMRGLTWSIHLACRAAVSTPLHHIHHRVRTHHLLSAAFIYGHSKSSQPTMEQHRSFCSSKTFSSSDNHNTNIQLPYFADTESTECAKLLKHDMIVMEDFISEDEEQELLKEIQPHFARKRYEYDHWDDAIHGFRETERSSWNAHNSTIIERLKKASFHDDVASPTEFVHVLDLEKDGEIKPHKDSVRFCGDTISGISLMSQSVMRLVHMENKQLIMDLLLKPRSLYIMRQKARFDYTHEILHNDKSFFKGEHIEKRRRISIICRNNPA